MKMDDKIKHSIESHIRGSWLFDDGFERISLEIGDEKCHIKYCTEGKVIIEKDFPPGPIWFGNYLSFWDPDMFHIANADEKTLVFGQHKSDLIDDVLWEREFHRV